MGKSEKAVWLVVLGLAALILSASTAGADATARNPQLLWTYSPAANTTPGVPTTAQIRKGAYVENKTTTTRLGKTVVVDNSTVVLGLSSSQGSTTQNQLHVVSLTPDGSTVNGSNVLWSATFAGGAVMSVKSTPDKTGDGKKDVLVVYSPDGTANQFMKVFDSQNGSEALSTPIYGGYFEGILFEPISGDFNKNDSNSNEFIIRPDSSNSMIEAID